ncbi:MAG: DUF3793 family protein [Anaerorhabdus sp.]
MSVETLVLYCAPALAGLKVSNLFSYSYQSICDLLKAANEYNELLNKNGIILKILKAQKGLALILVYRKSALDKVLGICEIQEFLKTQGYEKFDADSCFQVLREHLLLGKFPHEIGVFLGYPLEDIRGFIENKGQNSKYIGHWKVYGDVKKAKQNFNRFNHCIDRYYEQVVSGVGLTQLIVAG